MLMEILMEMILVLVLRKGSTNNFEYDGCIYDKVTDVVIEEDREKLVIREIWTSGTPTEQSSNCSAG